MLLNQKSKVMEVAVWDTWVVKKDGKRMHFDILVPAVLKDTAQIFAYGNEFLATRGQKNQPLTASECRFCHIEQADAELAAAIGEKGYSILEMEGC